MHLFGDIVDGEMVLNDSGRMLERWYYELENKFPDKRCDVMIVMPNHFHCIIEHRAIIQGDTQAFNNDFGTVCWDAHVGAPLRGRPSKYGMQNKKYNAAIGDVVRWLKTMSTNEYMHGVKQYNWKRFDKKLWQRNYYEHIIRNEQSYRQIVDYICNNPKYWHIDRFNDQ